MRFVFDSVADVTGSEDFSGGKRHERAGQGATDHGDGDDDRLHSDEAVPEDGVGVAELGVLSAELIDLDVLPFDLARGFAAGGFDAGQALADVEHLLRHLVSEVAEVFAQRLDLRANLTDEPHLGVARIVAVAGHGWVAHFGRRILARDRPSVLKRCTILGP